MEPRSATRSLAAQVKRARSGPLRTTAAIGLFSALAVGAPILWLLTTADTSTPGTHFPGASADTVDATGRLEPMMSVTIGSSDSGVIAEVFCDENVHVKKGQVCARLDPRPFQAEVDQDRASLATAKAQLEKDKASLTYASALAQRYRNLAVQRAVSEDQLENAASSAAQAKAQIDFDEASVAQHAATLETAQIALEYTNIVSPIEGVVVSRNATVGETIVAQFQSPTLFVIASDLARMQLNANVGEKSIDLIRTGDRVTYSLDALPNRQFEGTVRQIRLAPQRDGNAVSYIVSISADNREGLFRPGMLARATIHVGNTATAMR